MMVQHHEKYEEIHGEDKIVMMEYGEHRRLHARLRKEGKCNIPTNQLRKIGRAAYSRTEKGRKTQRAANRSIDIKRRTYRKEKQFGESVGINFSVVLKIRITETTGHIGVYSHFVSHESRGLVYIDI